MSKFIAKRVGFAAVLFGAASALTFLLVFANADGAIRQSMGETATDKQVNDRMNDLGLDRPVMTQYVEWLVHALTGDLGTSYFTGEPVTQMLASRITVTLSLVIASLLVTALLSVLVAVLAAVKGGWIDRTLQILSVGALAIPNFLVAIGLVFAFAISNPVFPATGYVPLTQSPSQWLQALILPVLAILVGLVAGSAQQFRGAMIDTLEQDYMRTLRSRGISERSLIWRHALRNAAGPGMTVLSLQTIGLLGGAVLIERVFALPGVGQLTQTAALAGDLPAVMGCVVFSVVVVVVVNIAADLLNAWINPKVRQA